MSVTLLVIKLVKSNSFIDIQSLNIPDIFLAFLVLNFFKSKESIRLHPLNIYDISLT